MSSYWDHKLLVSGNVYLTNAIGWCPPMMHAYIYIYTLWLPHCPVTETLTKKTSYYVKSLTHWHSKPRTTSSHNVIGTANLVLHAVTESLTANLVPRPVTESLTQQTSYHVQSQSHWQYTQCTYINDASWEDSSAYTPNVLGHLCSQYHDMAMYVGIYRVYIQPSPIYTHINMSSYWDHKHLVSGNVYLMNAIGSPPMMHA